MADGKTDKTLAIHVRNMHVVLILPRAHEIVGIAVGVFARRIVVELNPDVVENTCADGGAEISIGDNPLSISSRGKGIASNSSTQRKQHFDSPLSAACYISYNAAATSRSLWIVVLSQVCLRSLAIPKYIHESNVDILLAQQALALCSRNVLNRGGWYSQEDLAGINGFPLVPGDQEIVGIAVGILVRRVVVELNPDIVENTCVDGSAEMSIGEWTLVLYHFQCSCNFQEFVDCSAQPSLAEGFGHSQIHSGKQC
ncbi:hypothetical protein Cgig2_007914 [Carnegiea gigantea]|uniref:Uncharacterized protein n=1 Tax=Carnegiea gigantea TaxID=171969 RepID=A0A9Q1KDE4_9CARY|nr:hypothetical protein Cgig2_007914 [Carnegiea gigantea]